MNGTVANLKQFFTEEAAIVVMQVLGIIGKKLLGLLIRAFYTDFWKKAYPVDTRNIVKEVIEHIKLITAAPICILSSENGFGNPCKKMSILY